MNKKIKHFFGRILIMISLILLFVNTGMSQSMINMSTANCTISSNELQMDILVTNTGKFDLRWNSVVLRMLIPSEIIPQGSQTYIFNYIGGSDFPMSWPASPAKAFGATYNASQRMLTWTSGNTSAYNNSDCNAPLIGPGQTKTIGRFSFKITSSTFIQGASADLKWHSTSGCNLYEGCKKAVTAYNESSNFRTLVSPCKLIVPGP